MDEWLLSPLAAAEEEEEEGSFGEECARVCLLLLLA